MKSTIYAVLIAGLLSSPVLSFADDTANESSIELTNGDIINAQVLSQKDGKTIINHPVLGKVTIDNSKIKTLTSPQELAAEKAAKIQAAADKTKPEDKGLFDTGFMKDWKRNLSAGLSGSAGESNSQSMNADFTGTYEDKQTRMGTKLAYFRASSDSDLTDNAFYSSFSKDWLNPESPLFYFADGRADWDAFQPWDWRLSANVGPGYDFINTDKWLLSGKAGLGFSKTYGDKDQEFTPEGVLGVNAKWELDDRNHLELTNTFYPSFNDAKDYRNLTTFDWVLNLNSLRGAILKLGVRNEYDSTNDKEDVDNNSFKYTLSLGWPI